MSLGMPRSWEDEWQTIMPPYSHYVQKFEATVKDQSSGSPAQGLCLIHFQWESQLRTEHKEANMQIWNYHFHLHSFGEGARSSRPWKISHQILLHVKLAKVGSSLRPTARRIWFDRSWPYNLTWIKASFGIVHEDMETSSSRANDWLLEQASQIVPRNCGAHGNLDLKLLHEAKRPIECV